MLKIVVKLLIQYLSKKQLFQNTANFCKVVAFQKPNQLKLSVVSCFYELHLKNKKRTCKASTDAIPWIDRHRVLIESDKCGAFSPTNSNVAEGLFISYVDTFSVFGNFHTKNLLQTSNRLILYFSRHTFIYFNQIFKILRCICYDLKDVKRCLIPKSSGYQCSSYRKKCHE